MTNDELGASLSVLHKKMDTVLERTAAHKVEIMWLKRGLLGTISALIAWVTAHMTLKLGG